ncbi:hypothetical protein PRIPAC_81418 [Pristionchus pacificus]|uniref:Uncharacterized protein n=1 Tax=Pristionchus pacificus TaxID=54126 RepID=A0A2A6CM31_PRIPA|nr:hypothetical protein PRIPAC_81418 [Pristionchus pacificus]|eukprot:PDM79113.1 hypothetical protein PRIPAC_31692 [Pristionchus pacificus]
MLASAIVLLSTILVFASSLQCLHNSTVTYTVYWNGMLVRAESATYNMGVLECSAKLTRCVNFKAMDISFFNTLDSTFINLIKTANGKVLGRACMSESDCDKIEAHEATDCTEKQPRSCFCTSDICTGANGTRTMLMSLIPLLIYTI